MKIRTAAAYLISTLGILGPAPTVAQLVPKGKVIKEAAVKANVTPGQVAAGNGDHPLPIPASGSVKCVGKLYVVTVDTNVHPDVGMTGPKRAQLWLGNSTLAYGTGVYSGNQHVSLPLSLQPNKSYSGRILKGTLTVAGFGFSTPPCP